MTARHFHAELVDSNNGISKYRYTPDAISMKYYGLMEVNLLKEEIVILEYAPEDPDWEWGKDYQEYSANALGYKIIKAYREGKCIEKTILYMA